MALSKEAGRLDVGGVQVVTPEKQEQITMTIDPNGMEHILERLTSLYTNPIEATVREVVSNAVDATMRIPADQRKPVQVTTPNTYQTMFVVEDFGTGMNETVVREIYSKYGASTKTHDMSQIGAYGLGAKAPLSYCNEFLIETTAEGYTISLSISREKGRMSLNIISKEASDAPNGTKVMIPVRYGDEGDFSKALNSYRKYSFDVPVSIDGTQFDSTEHVLLTKDFVLDSDDDVRARVWVRKEALHKILDVKVSRDMTLNHVYVLSGWAYEFNNPVNRGYYYNQSDQTADMVIELKPGVVNFSSSRDEIVRDDISINLSNLVYSFIMDKNQDALEDYFAIYSELSDPEAFAFFCRAFQNADFDGKDTYYRESPQKEKMVFESEMFETKSGYNPFKETLETEYTNNVVGGVLINDVDKGTHIRKYAEGEKKRPYTQSVTPEINLHPYTMNNVTKMNGTIRKAAEDENTFTDVFSLITKVKAQTRQELPSRIVLVEDWDEERVGKILQGRPTLQSNGYNGNLLVFTLGDTAEQSKKAKVRYGANIVKKTADQVLEEIRDARRAAREAAKAATPNVPKFHLQKLDTSKVKDPNSEAEIVELYRTNVTLVSVDEIIEDNALLLLVEGQHRNALVGAANAGISITNRDIYIAQRGTNIYAKELAKLADYDGVVLSTDYKTRSKAAEELAKTRRFNGTLLDSTLTSLNEIDIVVGYLSVGAGFRTHFNEWLKTNKPHDTAALEIFTAAGGESNVRVPLEPKQIVQRYKHGQRLVDFMKMFSKFSNESSHYSGTVRGFLYTRMLNASSYTSRDNELREFVFERIYDHWIEEQRTIVLD